MSCWASQVYRMMTFLREYLIQACPFNFPEIFIIIHHSIVKDMHQFSCHIKLLREWSEVYNNLFLWDFTMLKVQCIEQKVKKCNLNQVHCNYWTRISCKRGEKSTRVKHYFGYLYWKYVNKVSLFEKARIFSLSGSFCSCKDLYSFKAIFYIKCLLT